MAVKRVVMRYKEYLWPAAWLAWGGFGLIMALRVLLNPAPQGVTDGARSVYLLFRAGGAAWMQGADTYSGACANFQYWPGFAAFMAPFSFLPYKAGALLWTALNLGLFLWAAVRVAREFLPARPEVTGAFLLLLLPMASEGIFNQQSNPLLIALTMHGVVQAARGRWWSACVLLLLPALTKIAPTCIPLLLLTMFPRPLWWRLPLCGLALAALPFALQHPDYVWREYESWLLTLTGEDGQRWAYRDGWTLVELIRDGVVTKHDVAQGIGWYRIVQLAMAGVAFLACVWLRYRRGLAQADAAVCALCFGMAWLLVFGPSTEVATCVSAAAAPAWILVRSWLDGRGVVLAVTAFLLTALGSSGEVEYKLYHLTGSDWPKALLPLGGLLLWAWLLRYSAGAGRASNSATPPQTSSMHG